MEKTKTVCGTDTTACGGSSEFGAKCIGCPSYDVNLDTRYSDDD